MAGSSQWKSRHSFEWSCEPPYNQMQRKSPVFRVRGIEHYFKFSRTMNGYSLTLELCKEASPTCFSSFQVTACAALKRQWDTTPFYGPRTIPCQLGEFLVFGNSVIASKMDNNHYSYTIIKFLFTFDSTDMLEFPRLNVETGEKSTQTDLVLVQPDLASVQPDLAIVQPDLEYLSMDLASLLENEVNPDIRLHCEDGVIRAHRAILSARSKVFATMFQTEMKEKESGEVDLRHMSLQTTGLFLKFIYSGRIPDFPVEMAPTLYSLGDKYDVPALKKMCSDFMARNVSGENYMEYLALADACGDGTFKQAVIAYVIDNPEWMKKDSWVKFSAEHSKLGLEVTQKFIDNLPMKK